MLGSSKAKCGCGGQDWRLWIRVVEARHIMWRGVESRVAVRVGRSVHTSSPRPASSAPYFGEEFTFSLSVPLEDLLDQVITLSVQQTQKYIPCTRVLGKAQLDICTVWEQPDHQITRKWAVLNHPTTETPAGFLLVDLAVLGHGDHLRLLSQDQTGLPIEQNLLAPSWAGRVRRCRARYAIRIYFAEGLPLRNPHPVSTINSVPVDDDHDPDPGPNRDLLDSSSHSLTRSSSPTSLSSFSASKTEEKTLIKSSSKRIKKQKSLLSSKAHKIRIASRFIGVLLHKHAVKDIENQVSELSDEDESEQVADPKQAHLTRGFHSCGCKARYLVRVSFAGKSGSTTLLGCDHFQPAWSEEVIVPEMFPPLYQRMNFQLLDAGRIIAQHRLHLNRATCDPAHQTLMGDPQSFSHGHSHSHNPLGGVIASYGPVFLNLSGPPLGRNPNKPSTVRNAVKGPQPRGRVLIELRVFCADTHIPRGIFSSKGRKEQIQNNLEVGRMNVAPLPLKNIWRSSTLTLACVIWDISMISRTRLANRKLSLQISLGSAGDHLLWQHTSDIESSRMLRQSRLACPRPEPRKATDCAYLFIPFGKSKPVVAVTAGWPWCVPDLRATNHIDRLAHLLQHQLTSSGRLIERGDPAAASNLVAAIDAVVKGCALILIENEDTLKKRRDDESSGTVPPGMSTRALFRVRQIEETALSVLQIGYGSSSSDPVPDLVDIRRSSKTPAEQFSNLSLSTVSSMYRKSYVLLGTMHDAISELGSGLPDVTLWLLADDKRVAAINLPARALLAARKQALRGRYCGRMHSVFLRDVLESSAWSPTKSSSHCKSDEGGGSVLAKVEAVFWLGTHKTAGSAIQRFLPGGSIRTRGLLPLTYNFLQEHKYECVVYVYQGRFAPGADRSGLNDPFVRVGFGPYCAQTEVSEASLSPRWKRLLRLPPVSICGDPASIQNRPPMVVIEAWDRDLWSNEFLGRVLVRPRVRLAGETSFHSNSKVSFNILPRGSWASGNTPIGETDISNYQDLNDDLDGCPNLRWLPMSVGNTRTGDVLAAVELIQVSEDTNTRSTITESEISVGKSHLKKKTRRKSKRKSSVLSMVVDELMPQHSTYRLEIIFWGLRDMKKPTARPPDHYFVVFEIAGTVFQSSRLDPNESLNFPDCYSMQVVTLPTMPDLLPAVHIKLLRRQVALLCRQYVATNVIPSLSAFLWDFEHEPDFRDDSSDANIFRVVRPFNSEHELSHLDEAEDEGTDADLAPLLFKHINEKQQRLSNARKLTRRDESNQNVQDTTLYLQRDVSRTISSTISTWRKIGPGKVFLSFDFKETWAPDSSASEHHSPVTGPPSTHIETVVDWWSRYYASLDRTARTTSDDDIECGINPICRRVALKKWNPPKDSENGLENDLLLEIYPDELEAQFEFENFQDFLYNIELNRGKADFPEDSELPSEEGRSARAAAAAVAASYASHRPAGQVVATLKSCIRLERLAPGVEPGSQGRLWKLADNGRQPVTVRVYVIRAHALHGRLRHGRANPYLSVTFGRHNYDGHDLRQRGVLDPIFGKCIEFVGEFPFDHRLTVRVMGGLGGSRQLLGQTHIDLENRFYSRHLGGCGLPRRYEPHGPNAWRDSRKPIDILAGLCRSHNLPDPIVDLPRATLLVGDCAIQVPKAALRSSDPHVRTQEIALAGLLSWHTFPRVGFPLVPAHVETRSLIHPDHPGVEQGKLEMWVDVIPTGLDGVWSSITTTLILPPPVDIEPPSPRGWELRVVVIQAKNVVRTERNFLSREEASDIYVVGWIGGIDQLQKTDVHFRSVNGEGFFNWRFVFPFEYVSAEGRIVIGDRRIPPRLHLALMDYDTFTKDDILGSLTFDLRKFLRPTEGAQTSENAQVVDLFRVGHARGWWTISAAEAAAKKGRKEAGKVELDIQLLTQEDASQDPVGLGRNPPHKLDEPKRPNDAISMLRHPLLGLYYIVWGRNRKRIICGFLVAMALAGLVAGVYALPKYLIRRFFRVT